MACTSASLRRSPRHSVTHQSLSPRRSPRKSTLHEFAAERSETPEIEVELHVYRYHPPLLDLHLGRSQHGPLYYQTIPKRFNPFTSDGIWSFSPRGGIARTPLLGRKIGDIHASILPGANDATFWVCVSHQDGHGQFEWVEATRGSHHPLYPTHVLFQRGRSAPRWILAESYARYIRKYKGIFSVFSD
ncbi:hypothetical protein FRC12_004851 [Ceratobasidium sp. 428]|nr:hypothetical protein FRC12_004851 [Ceratobasidium sp. 428]